MTDFEFVGSEDHCEGRTVIVVCGVDVGRGLALCALAGTGGLVTVLIDKVEEMEESRDWTDWKNEERYRSEVMAEDFNGCLQVYKEGKDVADAQRRKSWQTCYGPAQHGIKRR